MALEISVYNRQPKTSNSGKEYVGYACVFEPGQRGLVPALAKVPPFYVREQKGRRTDWIRLDAQTFDEAKAEAEKMQAAVQARQAGVDVVDDSEDRERLAAKIKAYLAEIEANKSKATLRAYRLSLEMFQESCKRAKIADVCREDMLAFKTYLKSKELHSRSVYNRFLNVTIFFVWARGAQNALGLKKNDWPPKVEREPEAYTEDELKSMLAAAEKDEALLIQCYLSSGLRNRELMHLTYDAVDPRTSIWTIQPTGNHSLKTKSAQRFVTVGDWLTQKVMDKKQEDGAKGSDLIFPSPMHGTVNNHIIRVIRKVAKKAGIEGRVDVHKFRATAITMWLRSGLTVPETMALVGHSTPDTILRYAEKVNLAKKENRERVAAPFNGFRD